MTDYQDYTKLKWQLRESAQLSGGRDGRPADEYLPWKAFKAIEELESRFDLELDQYAKDSDIARLTRERDAMRGTLKNAHDYVSELDDTEAAGLALEIESALSSAGEGAGPSTLAVEETSTPSVSGRGQPAPAPSIADAKLREALEETIEFLRDTTIPFPPALHDKITDALHALPIPDLKAEPRP